MIIVLCRSEIAEEKQAEFIEKVNAAGIIPATNKEEGCISYELSASAGIPGVLYVTERWESMEFLKLHTTGANFAAFGKLSAEYGVKTEMKLYKADALN